jgi:Sigma-70, region 4
MSRLLNSQRYPAAAATYEPAMTFEQIGERLGMKRQDVYVIFARALKKLRANKQMRTCADLAILRDSLRKPRIEEGEKDA